MAARDSKSRQNRTLKARIGEDELSRLRAAHFPLPQNDALQKLLEWFCEQPEAIQKQILGLLPRDMEQDIARILLRRMAGK